ncbi:aminomethyltransferase family protein [Clostridium thailandense]|uniref:aminomethyltransferase family protein n=1 Tax=Clostridium thailandense TaxID=2794346 RepID=UPI003988F9DC
MKQIYIDSGAAYKQKNVLKYDDMKRSEHMAVRTTAGWYLWTHQLLEVTGDDAAKFLDFVCPNPIVNLKVGKERYTTMLNQNGIIIDDVVVFRVEEQKFWVSTLFVAALTRWLDGLKEGYAVEFKNISLDWHMYAVQGSKSLDMVNDLVETPVTDLKFFSFAENTIGGEKVIINRAGFTGEKLGYEIYIAADKADFLEEKLDAAAAKVGAKQVTEFQIMAWTLPTEAGFYYMRDLRDTNPLEVGLDKSINWDKEFVGKEALLKVKEEGPAREVVGFTTEEADLHIHGKNLSGPGPADAVFKNGEEIGNVIKFVYSYVEEKTFGTIIAKKGALKNGDRVKIRSYEAVITDKSIL